MKKSLILILFVSGVCSQELLSAAQKLPVSDDQINDQVRMKLTTDADVKGGADEVTVKDGIVTIRGRVDTDKGKAKATKLAKKIKGVKSVENELVVGPPK